MKVALLFSGMPRFVKECFPYYKRHLLDKFDVDVFGALWKDSTNVDGNSDNPLYQYKPCDANTFIETYKPKSFISIDYNHEMDKAFKNITDIKLNSLNLQNIPHTRAAMFYLIEQSQILKNFSERFLGKYDVVIRARTDTVIYNTPDLDKMRPNTIYMSLHGCSSGINDTFWYSDSETSDKVNYLFSFLNTFNFTDLQTRTLAHEYVVSARVITNGVNINYTLDNQVIYKYSALLFDKDRQIKPDLFITKENGWVGHPGFNGLINSLSVQS